MHVILRYVFNRPTIWAWDVNVQLLGLLGVMGAGYTLLHRGHVGVDVLAEHLSPRARMILELIMSLFFFLAVGVLVWVVGRGAWTSLQVKEVYTSFWSPPLYPFKVVVVIGVLFLLLQGIVKFIRDLSTFIELGRRP